jgi:hypothetical protein
MSSPCSGRESATMSDDPEHPVGKGSPPIRTRFQPNQTGNPKGRPRGKRRAFPYEAVLGQMVTVKENGVERQLPADAAFMLHLGNRALAGDEVATRATLNAIGDNATSAAQRRPDRTFVFCVYLDKGDITRSMRDLKMAQLLDRFRPTAHMALEPWLVEASLDRLGERQLSVAEQETVVAATRRPGKVRWPSWWTVYAF